MAALLEEWVKDSNGQVCDHLKADLQQNFLSKPSSQKVIAALHQGDRLRDAAAKASVSVEVARKILAVMQR